MQAILERVAGVQMVEMDFKQRTAKVVYNPEKTDPEILVAAVGINGIFKASVLTQMPPSGEDVRDPDSRDGSLPKNKEKKEQPKDNSGGI